MISMTTRASLRVLSNGMKHGAQIARRLRPYMASVFALALVGGWLFSFTPTLFAQQQNQIALVVIHGDGRATTSCVDFSEQSLTGYQVLQYAKMSMSINASAMGVEVCSLDGEGCTVPQEDCFCGMNRTPQVYWSYWQLEGGAWKYSNLGASNITLQPGAVQAWKWGSGEDNPPPAYTFAQICAPAPAEPTATFTPLPSPTFPPTATDAPSSTPTITPTPTPSFTPSYTPFPTATPTFPFPTSTATWTPTPTWTPSPTFTPTPTWTVAPANMQSSPLETPTPTLTFTPESGAVAAQPNVQGYALRLPVVQGPMPTIVVAEVATDLPTATLEATTTPMPTDTPLPTPTPEVVAMVATAVPTPLPEVPTTVPPVVVVVTAASVAEPAAADAAAMMPTNLPAATAAPAADAQMTTLLSMIIGAGVLVALPVGLILVAGIAYWIGRKL